jgi:hypothetical protein
MVRIATAGVGVALAVRLLADHTPPPESRPCLHRETPEATAVPGRGDDAGWTDEELEQAQPMPLPEADAPGRPPIRPEPPRTPTEVPQDADGRPPASD